MPKLAKLPPELHPRIRIMRGKTIALGPGKIELLGHIAETRSLNQAAKRMKMSYMKAWLLVKLMNSSYREPLVKAERGGAGGGGAELTPMGQQVLELYQEMEAASLKAMSPSWTRMRKLLAEE